MKETVGFTIAGNDAEEMLNASPLFESQIVKIQEAIKQEENKAFYEACYKIHIDPEIVEKQAKLIEKLQFSLDILGNQYVGCNFTAFMDLQRENILLKKQITDIKKILGVDENDL